MIIMIGMGRWDVKRILQKWNFSVLGLLSTASMRTQYRSRSRSAAVMLEVVGRWLFQRFGW